MNEMTLLLGIIASLAAAAGFVNLLQDLSCRVMWTLSMAGNKMGEDQEQAEEAGYPVTDVRDHWWFILALGYLIYIGVFK